MKISSLSSCLLCSCRCQCRSKREILTLRHSVSSKAHVIKYISLYSQCDARTLKNKTYIHVPCLEDSVLLWQMIFPTLFSLRLLAVIGRRLRLFFRVMICSEQADSPAHTQKSFSLGCVHKRVSVHKHRPRFCP